MFARAAADDKSLEWARQDGRREDLLRLERAVSEHPEMLDQMFHRDGPVIVRP